MACNHVVEIWVANKEHQESMQDRISKTTPQLLSTAAGKSSCCIFRVPQSFVEINGINSYHPRIVSIGPYHRGKPHLQMIEEHKWRYLRSLLSRTQTMGISLENYFQSIHPLEKDARDSYSETIHLDPDAFLEMMILDGCFMLELFRKVNNPTLFVEDDPLATMAWILPFLYRDFLRLENQIPFFVLEKLFEISKMPDEKFGPSFSVLAMRFFNNAMLRDEEVIDGFRNLKGLHLLDLVRSSFIPPDHEFPPNEGNVPTHIIHCVSKLRRSGIRLTPGKAESFMVVKFKHGVIEMPRIAIDDFMSSFLVNCVAFEQCHKSRFKHVTTYVTLLDYLVNSAKDVEYLSDRNIIENDYGTEGEVARFINNMGKEVAFDFDKCYLSKLFNDVHNYHQNSWHVQLASFKYTYFDTPWSFISALAAFVLLVLSFLQTFYTIYGFIHS
ncbi:hypothetical protein I3760_10G006000 [Carya illinoinensis]|uniref:Uncharacterized protein n=1 Tax=Carya illinoinensis TaxID=32201 RepID=A0A8T1P942_CARIL|nr:UPF0481 protein At3g47200-like [Carya illinoinensis]KAG2682909.1 hypothetical protein I3760_10G006000 [Carya illinoinensis]KAG6638023.1 hypothetical protein CIPAW_10G006100 [Carya illinoinensis]KAG6690275.1 hypothetical protein I3842_10G006200 [Carya illinoinensis]